MLAMSDGELLRGFRSTLNFTDRAYLIFFIVISALLLFRTHRVPARGAMLFGISYAHSWCCYWQSMRGIHQFGDFFTTGIRWACSS